MLDALLPLACPGCGRSVGARGPICAGCAARLRPPVPAAPPAGLEGWFAPFAYEGVAREVVARVKYRGARAAVPWLADAMVASIDGRTGSVDAVTWAPTSRARRRARGFDPAELLARAIARRLRTRVVGLLERRPGPPQTGLHADARRQGPRFGARARVVGAVLLVDDVATTGATLSAAARALRAAGTHTVLAVTAARTPPPRRP